MKIKSRWRYMRLQLLAAPRHQQLVVGARNDFNVPLRVDGEGRLLIGSGNSFGYRLAPMLGNGEILLQARGQAAVLQIGQSNQFSNNISIVSCGRITIGDRCLIGDQVAIYDCDAHEVDPVNRHRSSGEILPVSIGNNVWLGSRVIILKGVTIGDNSVIGAMSVVTRSIPPNCIAAGNPARVLRTLDH